MLSVVPASMVSSSCWQALPALSCTSTRGTCGDARCERIAANTWRSITTKRAGCHLHYIPTVQPLDQRLRGAPRHPRAAVQRGAGPRRPLFRRLFPPRSHLSPPRLPAVLLHRLRDRAPPGSPQPGSPDRPVDGVPCPDGRGRGLLPHRHRQAARAGAGVLLCRCFELSEGCSSIGLGQALPASLLRHWEISNAAHAGEGECGRGQVLEHTFTGQGAGAYLHWAGLGLGLVGCGGRVRLIGCRLWPSPSVAIAFRLPQTQSVLAAGAARLSPLQAAQGVWSNQGLRGEHPLLSWALPGVMWAAAWGDVGAPWDVMGAPWGDEAGDLVSRSSTWLAMLCPSGPPCAVFSSSTWPCCAPRGRRPPSLGCPLPAEPLLSQHTQAHLHSPTWL
jgi:hypothetical protein